MLQSPGENIQYVDFVSDNSFYKVHVDDVQMGGQSLHGASSMNQGMGAIVDSGTTFTYLPKTLHTSLLSQIQAQCGDSLCGSIIHITNEDLCYKVGATPITDTLWPSMTIIFNNSPYVMLAPSLFYVNDKSRNIVCLGVYEQGPTGAILGSNSMRDINVIFDLSSMRMGWVKAPCNSDRVKPGQDNIASSPATVTPSHDVNVVATATGSSLILPRADQVNLDVVTSTMMGLIIVGLIVVIGFCCIQFILVRFCRRWKMGARTTIKYSMDATEESSNEAAGRNTAIEYA